MTTYAVGDIQGCLEPLQCLLEAVDFTPSRDTLWSAGDILNRGPSCLQTLRYLHSLRDSLIMVLGNHDLHLLAVAAGVREPHPSDTLGEILTAPDRDLLLDWLRQQPLLHHANGHTLVHAGIPPQWSITEALGYAAEVSEVLQGSNPLDFYTQMYGNEPNGWSDDLEGMTRLRVITNYFTRMRFCTAQGSLDLLSKRATPEPSALIQHGDTLAPWFEHRDPEARDERILFGHWASLKGETRSDRIIGLDTGCVWGGTLSLYALETASWTRCDCATNSVTQ